MISIIIPSYSNATGLRACVASIVKHTDLSDCEILVIANGAPEETAQIEDIYRDYPVKLIWLPEAIGYTRACNEGMKAAQGDYFVLLNDDCVILGSHWLAMLQQPFLDDPLVALTGPLMLTAPECNRGFLVFFCVMISRRVTESIGLLDEIFNPGYAEDCDYAMRAVNTGWKIQQVPSSQATLIDKGCEDLPDWKRDKMWCNPFPCYHDGNKTFGADPKFEGLIKRNSAILMERYGPKVSDPNRCERCGGLAVEGTCLGAKNKPNCDGLYLWRAHVIDGWFNIDEGAWLAQQVKALPPNSKVLEVGSWHGRSSRFIADNLSEGSQVVCVDSWNGSSGEPDAHLSAAQREGDHAHSWWWCNLHEHVMAGCVIPMREHSANAAETLGHLVDKGEMEKFSLIFIDGDHSAEGIKQDMEAWLPLLKEGGLLCGHDYYKENEGPYWVHVRQYVEEKFPNVEKSATSIWHVRPHVEQVEQQRGHIFDCFLFSAELDILEIRLATLYDHVDRFVLVESETTHAGQSKPLHFELNKDRFSKYLDKITHIVTDLPTVEGSIYDQAWARERAQRDACLSGLQNCQPDDIVIIGDADEIAHPDAIASYRVSDGIVRLKQRMFYYYLNCENREGWDWQKIAPYSEVKRLTPCGIRYPPAGETPLIENGGWHFSMMGGSEAVKAKLVSYSHQEMNRPEILDNVEAKIAAGEDVFGRDLKYEFVGIDSSYPECVQHRIGNLEDKGLIRPLVTLAEYVTDDRDKTLSMAERVTTLEPPDFSARHWTVTAEVSTKDRYTTTLPLALSAIINQMRLPDKLKIYDDGAQVNLFELAPFNGLLRLAQDKGIDVEVLSTPRQGQVANHQHCLDAATTDFIWRVDDDEIPEPDCLETLLNTIRDRADGDYLSIGAVGGLVHHPGNVSPLPQGVDGSLNDVAVGLNLSWYQWNGGPRQVEHLYSTFLYQVDAARKAGGYPRDLSPVGHREETIFSHSLHRAGYTLLTTPWAKTHHLRESTGGIRSFSDNELWQRDEQVFQGYLNAWGVVQPDTKLLVCDFGLGDHLILKGIWTELRRKFPERKWTMALCFPEVFKGESDVTVISIADAKLLLGNRYDEHSVYRYCWDNNFTRPMPEVMMEFYSR